MGWNYPKIMEYLKKAGIENAAQEARWLLEAFEGEEAALPQNGTDREYEDPKLDHAVIQRGKHYPLQYLLGEWPFYNQKYELSPDCLIPRQDTERLVEQAIKILPENGTVLDLCTGSGCIAVSLLAERPDAKGVAVDKFPKVLELAERNARKNGVLERLEWIQSDILEAPVPEEIRNRTFDMLLSNPPYIRTDIVRNGLPAEVSYEPKEALDGGEDGLLFYRAILEKYYPLVKENGWVLFEIGYDQGEALLKMGEQIHCAVSILKDYGGNDRVAVIQKP